MTKKNPETGELRVELPAEYIEGLKEQIGQFAATNSIDISIADIQNNLADSGAHQASSDQIDDGNEPMHCSGLFAWTIDPDTGDHTRVITSDTMTNFSAYSDEDPGVVKRRARRFFSFAAIGLNDDLTDEGFVMVGNTSDNPIVGIRESKALELLRKLKSGGIGEEKPDGSIGIYGVSNGGISFFEDYCRELFPGVDVLLATQPLDLEKLDRMLSRSSIRRAAWGWVGAKEKGDVFRSYGLVEEKRKYGGGGHLNYLRKLGLIDRRPVVPHDASVSLMDNHLPFVKLSDDRWEDINKLLIDHDALDTAL